MKQGKSTIQSLPVWQEAHTFTLNIYALTSRFPKEEMRGLTTQMRRAAVSLSAHIAESYSRSSKRDKTLFLDIAQGSLAEQRYYLQLALDLDYGDTTALEAQLDIVSELLDSQFRALQSVPQSKAA